MDKIAIADLSTSAFKNKNNLNVYIDELITLLSRFNSYGHKYDLTSFLRTIVYDLNFMNNQIFLEKFERLKNEKVLDAHGRADRQTDGRQRRTWVR